MKALLSRLWSFLVKHKKKALTVAAVGAAAAADGATGAQVTKAIVSVVLGP